MTHPIFEPTTHSYSLATTQPDIQQLVPVETNPTPLYEVTSASIGFLVLFSSFILLYCSMQRWKSPQPPVNDSDTDKLWSANLIYELPCTRCQYFRANRYLACAVQPLQVLKPEAKDCTDFQEREM